MLKFFIVITYVWNMWLEHQKYPNVAANIKTFRLLLYPKAFIISATVECWTIANKKCVSICCFECKVFDR